MQIIFHEESKGGLSHGLICPGVVGKLGQGEVVGPISLVMIDVELEVLFDPLVLHFGLPVHPWVISCGNILRHTKESTQLMGELGCKLWVSVADDL